MANTKKKLPITVNASMNNVITLHGVFLNILGQGILLTGKSGIGKSLLALSLINRGHQLIADDAVEFKHNGNHELIGHCPTLLKDFLDIHGAGLFNIRLLFGDKAIAQHHPLHLIIELIEPANIHSKLIYNLDQQNLLNCKIPSIRLPVVNQGLDLLVETLIKRHILQESGYDALTDFINKHHTQLELSNV